MPRAYQMSPLSAQLAVLQGTDIAEMWANQDFATEWLRIVLPNPLLAAFMLPALGEIK